MTGKCDTHGILYHLVLANVSSSSSKGLCVSIQIKAKGYRIGQENCCNYMKSETEKCNISNLTCSTTVLSYISEGALLFLCPNSSSVRETDKKEVTLARTNIRIPMIHIDKS